MEKINFATFTSIYLKRNVNRTFSTKNIDAYQEVIVQITKCIRLKK